jgi:hypothetical protein
VKEKTISKTYYLGHFFCQALDACVASVVSNLEKSAFLSLAFLIYRVM